ncbi:MAG: Glycosyl transferase, group 1 family [Candidatus Daviesbacteria bacterium GW2011_GWA1_41_61]|uniref:Glycosyl transferase, group 1 family n=1 Tax=Candidatus Daviesbacteria bacterium GW2011_GWA2_40_9 TaxID=1618424 RepID=A0A0G0WF52_9BACT|nr:MAG: Glycosyl transferase, group 1 family [Candidatus Daviesbacteria bacterium GW2011_GWA2_40_9]KKR92848.1 MAG: Glycosyl transferase, group 1 family [Candidatus Daviesbacteria bacterium GW2011_GWB1_41_15]KKS15392.1 MAG: Glycosyl transferase, group 1 family [Candidatus Daviesbacteria bacterium GW2011_GWA1_41_61]
MFGWEFPPYNSGGLGVACLGLTRALASKDVELIFVLPYKMDLTIPNLRLVFANSRVKLRPVDSLLIPYSTVTSYQQLFSGLSSKIYANGLLAEVNRYALEGGMIAGKESFDIIHAHDWLSFGAGLAAKKVSGKPLIVHVHATEFDRSGENINQLVYNLEKEGMEEADEVIAVSQYTKDIIVERYGISPDKIEVVWNGIDPEDYQPVQPEDNGLSHWKALGYKIVLFVGRITMQKGPDYFLQAAKKVLSYNPQVIFVIAGSGDMENQIISQAASLGISDKVLFAGFLRGNELNTVYRIADLFVLPSVSEPFGIVPLEAAVNGTPVLISKQSGVSEALTHALKVDFWDIDEMADKILAVLNNPSLYGCLKENGQREVQKLSWKEAARKCISIYHKLFSRGEDNA